MYYSRYTVNVIEYILGQVLTIMHFEPLQTQRRWRSKNSPVTGLEWPRGFQEVKVPCFHEKAQDGVKVVSPSTGRIYPQEILLVLISVRG
jgi:hypothetical protein